MPRAPRIHAPNLLFHVINRGNNRKNIFYSPRDYIIFIRLVKRYKKKFGIKLYHYVLMPNHIHFLLEPLHQDALSKFMHDLTLAYAKNFCKRNNFIGHVWQGRYKEKLIEKDSYLLQCGKYIELNPVRAGFVQHPQEYEWSSYNEHMGSKNDPITDFHLIYNQLGEDEETFRHTYKAFIDKLAPVPGTFY